MYPEFSNIKTLIFDFGNTLIEFSYPQMEECDTAMESVLKGWYGTVDREHLTKIRNIDRLAPYKDDFRENDLVTITIKLVQALYGEDPSDELLDELLKARFEAFVCAATDLPDYLQDHLGRLQNRYQIGLLSNYPCGKAIRESLERLGIDHYFHSVVVSADIGHVKPHPLVFNTITEKLQVRADECLFIGDNWLGDIQGAKRAGMKAIHTTQFETPEKFDRQTGDHSSDGTINHLLELETLLGIS